ncbi:MAG: hypothetical protein ACLFSN_01425 [Candidatus Woesearchaeota archaeon]
MTGKRPKKPSTVHPRAKEIVAPLSQRFFLTSIIGFLLAVMFIADYSVSWAVVVGIISMVMFLASMISMTRAPVEDELALDEHRSGRKDRVVVLSKKEYEELKRARAKKNLSSTTTKNKTTGRAKKSTRKT